MTGAAYPLKLTAEALVVVFSILAAFAIDAWWDDRQTSALEQGLLASLEDAFAENRRLADLVIAEAGRQQTYVGRFIDMSPEEAGRISPDSVYVFFRALWRPNVITLTPGGLVQAGPGLNNAAILAMLQAGRLSLLSDPRLLDALAEWQGTAEALAVRSERVVALEGEVLEVLARHPQIQPALSGLDERGDLPSFGARAPRLPSALGRRVREDNEVMSRAARKGFYSRIEQQYLEQLRDRDVTVLDLLRENRRR